MLRRVVVMAIAGLILMSMSQIALAKGCVDSGCRSNSPQEDEDPRSYTVIKVKRVITVSGDDLENATIVIKDGTIEAVGENVDYPYGAKVIDATDMVVMPGMINPVSRMGRLPGGGSSPHADKSEDLTLTGKELIDIAATGYTTLGLLSSGAPMPGRVLIVKTAGEKPEDLVINGKGPIQVSFNSPGSSKAAVLRAFESAKKALDKIKKAEEAAAKKAKTAKKAPKKGPKTGPKPTPKPKPGPKPKPTPKPKPKPKDTEGLADPPKPVKKKTPTVKIPKVKDSLQPLVDLMKKKKGVTAIVEFGNSRDSIFRSNPSAASSYLHWQDVLKKFDFAHSYRIYNTVVPRNSPFFVTSETNVEKVAEEIGKRKGFVALYPVVNHHPFTRNKYNLALLLRNTGSKPVFIPQNDRWDSYASMRDNLVNMVRTGFPKSEILKTVTLYPAQMLGIDDQVGTIESGRVANLIFLSGDPLSYTSEVKKVMVDGKFIEFKKRLR